MKKILYTIFLIGIANISQAQVLDRVWAYEGADYFAGTINSANFKGTVTLGSRPLAPTATRDMHLINTGLPTSNSSFSLGWAGDWINSAGVANGHYFVRGGESSIEITGDASFPNSNSLVNTGLYIHGGGGTSIGRRLQTSTAGSFYRYTFSIPLTNGQNPVNQGGTNRVVTAADSPIRTNASTAPANHNAVETAGAPTPLTVTGNTRLGAQGTSIWVAFMMNKRAANDEECYISLHRNANPFDVNQTNAIQIGYFGTASNAGGNRYWGVRANGVVSVNTANDNTRITTTGADANFDLLVAQISYDYTGNHRVRLYVIRDRMRTGYLSAPLPGTNFDALVGTPPSAGLNTAFDLELNVAGATDISFHSVAYFGGTSADASALDELRFAPVFDDAALNSLTISVISGLCEEGGGTSGENIYPQGSFGVASSVDANGIFLNLAAGETQGSNGPWALGAGGGNNVNLDLTGGNPDRPVIFKNGDALLEPGPPPVRYDALTPGGIFQYKVNNLPGPGNQPDDGSYSVATQCRNIFGTWNGFYDNSPDKNGLMMIVNAAYARGKFFERTIGGLCNETQYEFFVDLFNIIRSTEKTITDDGPATSSCCSDRNACDPTIEPGCQQFSFGGTDQSNNSGIGAVTANTPGAPRFFINPDVEFLINDKPVYVPPITVANDNRWHRVGFTFVTKPLPAGAVQLAFRNRAPGGIGNDVAVDNITFRPCGPRARLVPTGECQPIIAAVSPGGAGYTAPTVLWQKSSDGGITWVDIPTNGGSFPNNPAATSSLIPNPPFILAGDVGTSLPQDDPALFVQGDMIRAVIAGNATDIGNPRCRITTDPEPANCPSILPVNLFAFNGIKQLNGIALRWTTTQEIDFEKFIVERSFDARDFLPIATVQARGGNQPNNYSVIDGVPYSGTNYYRLKQVDSDGTFTYSKTIAVEWDDYDGISIYPNPADKEIYVMFSMPNGAERQRISMQLVNTIGTAVQRIDTFELQGNSSLRIETSNLKEGLYFLEMNIEGRKVVNKVLIKH
jgi:hypothetical protein